MSCRQRRHRLFSGLPGRTRRSGPGRFRHDNSLHLLNNALVDPDILWHDLALAMYARVTPSFAPTTLPAVLQPADAALWALFRPHKMAPVDSSPETQFWSATATAAQQRVLHLNMALLPRSSLLLLPPLVFVDKPALRSILLAQMYYQSACAATGGPGGLCHPPSTLSRRRSIPTRASCRSVCLADTCFILQ